MSVLSIAHRGFSGLYPQNTLLAFLKADEEGVDFIELDVSLTKDDQIVVFHDSEVSNLTNGAGYIKDLKLSEVRKIDAGIKTGTEFKGAKIPTLEDVLVSLKDSDVKLCIEVKAREYDKADGIDEIIDALLRKYGYLDRVMFSSYNRQVVKMLAKRYPEMWIGFDPSEEESKTRSSEYIVELCLEYEASILYFDHLLLTKELVDLAHQNSLQVHAWTADDAKSIIRLIEMGADGILTNRPDILNEVRSGINLN